jgi:hypothetical protein
VLVIRSRAERRAHRLDQPFRLLGELVHQPRDRPEVVGLSGIVAVGHPLGRLLHLADLEPDGIQVVAFEPGHRAHVLSSLMGAAVARRTASAGWGLPAGNDPETRPG